MRRLAVFVVSAALWLPPLWLVSPGTVLATNSWVVNSAADTSGTCTASLCTLRSAIDAANAAGGNGTISFDIAPGGPQVIQPATQLPTVTAPNVVIDGTTQPSGGAHGIQLNDPNSSDSNAGLAIGGTGDTVRGLSVTNFGGYGILLWYATGATIAGNWVGTADGTTAAGNRNIGIMIQGGGSNTIGGATSADRNVVSGTIEGWTGNGVQIQDSNDNVVVGNYLGMTADGLDRMWNAGDGLQIAGASSGNRIGGTTAAERNIDSGNTGMGVQLLGVMNSDGTCRAPTNNVVEGNYIGVNANGARPGAYGNLAEGLSIDICGQNNLIGGTSAGAGNVISGNNDDGMQIDGLNGPAQGVCNNTIQGNYVGVDPTGSFAIDNGVTGIKIQNGACNTLVGGTAAGAGNVVSGNLSDAFYIRRPGTTGTQIVDNIIGLGANGTQWIGGGDNNVHIWSGASGTLVSGNIISASATNGVLIQDQGTDGNTITDNRIGTDASGTTLDGNRNVGVWITNGAESNTVRGNIVAGSGVEGVVVEEPSGVTTPTNDNRISQNRMWANTGLGIDLQPVTGVNPNDGNDTNTTIGNDGMDFPVITAVSSTSAMGTAPAASTVELFSATADTGTPNGEGTTFLGSTTATSSGTWCIGGLAIGGPVTATATDPNGNTSEFSVNVTPSGSTAYCASPSPSPSPTPSPSASPTPTPSPSPTPTPSPTGSPSPSPSPSVLYSDDFSRTDGSAPTGWTVTQTAGGSGSGAVIESNLLQATDALSSAQNGLWEYVQARAPIQPSWASSAVTFGWQMSTSATSSQVASLMLLPTIPSGNAVSASDYLRVRVSAGTLSLVTRSGGGTVTTLWSGPETMTSGLRQFQLQVSAGMVSLWEGPVGGTLSLRASALSDGLAWTSGYLYLHAHNDSSASAFVVDYDTVVVSQ